MRTLTKKVINSVLVALLTLSCFMFVTVTDSKTVAKADSPTVTCSGVNQWNNNNLSGGYYVTLLDYDIYLGDAANATNVVSTTGQGITLNGVKLSEISGAVVDYAHGKNRLEIKIPQSYQEALAGDIVLEVIAGTHFENQVLDGAKFTLLSAKWTKMTSATFSDIRHNNVNYQTHCIDIGGTPANGIYVTLRFFESFGDTTDTTNLATEDYEIGTGLKINGVSIKDISGSFVDASAGSVNMHVYVPFTGLSEYKRAILTVDDGTAFRNKYINAFTVYFNGSSWTTTANTKTAVTFSNIQWNNQNYDTTNFGGNGVLLNYSANLSTVGSELNGGIPGVELKSYYGKYITLNGETLDNIAGAELRYHSLGKLWIYAPGMTAWNGRIPTIEIAANAPFLDAYLPALTLYFNGSAWQTSNPRRAVNFSSIAWNSINYDSTNFGGAGVLLRYDANLSLVANEINGNIRSVELKSLYGSYITVNGETLDNIAGAELRYHSLKDLWIYAPGMTSRDGTNAKIEIAANAPFSFSYLPALTLFWNGNNAWQVAEPNPTFSAVANNWVNNGWFIAQFNTGAWTHNKVPTSYTGIKYNGNNITDLCSTVKFYLTNGLWLVYNANDDKLSANYNGYSHPTIEIEENATVVYDGFTTTLPAMKFYYVNGAWQTTEPDGYYDHMVDFVSVQHNNINYGTHCIDIGTIPTDGFYATLNFSESFGAAADSTNYATNSYSIGTGLKINGVSIKDISGAFVDAAHGNNFMSVYVPFTALSEYKRATLTVDAGTEFRGKYLNAFTVYFKGNSWSTTANTKTAVSFSNIQWNNTGWDVFAGKNGVLLNYSAFLSTVSSDANQSAIAGVELKSYYGSYITINGVTLDNIANAELRYYNQGNLWIYSPNMKTWAGHIPTIEIAANTPFLDAYLPALTIYFNSETNQWQLEEPEIEIVIPDLGTPDCDFTGFSTWNNNNGMTLLQFRSFVNIPTATAEYTSTTGYYITYNGTRLADISGARVASWEGQCWLRIDIPNPAANSVLIIEEGTPFADNYLPKIVLKLVNGVWCTAFEVNITIDSDTYTVYSKDDVPVIINDEYLETLLSERSIPAKAIGFEVRGVTYKAGTTFKALTNTDITVQAIGFNTARGASVRLKSPTGIRFETYIDKADYDALVARVGSANVETGTYIMPRSFLENSDFRSYLADGSKISGTDYVKIVNNGFANKDTAESNGYYVYYGSLVNIKPNNYCTDFFGIGYIKITDGANVYTVFGGYDLDDHTRTIYYVSGRVYPDFEDETFEKSVLQGYLDGVLRVADDVEISDLIEIDGYDSPYTVTYNSQTGVYTVTGNAEIKSVMIGDKKRISARTNTLTVSGDTYYITDYNLTTAAGVSTLTFKISPVPDPLTLVDFSLEIPSDRGVKILQLTDTEIIDALQMRTSGALTSAQQEEYARKNIYANCFNYITELVENDRPDLIIISGDIVNGNFDDNGSMWLKLIDFMDSLDIPWAPVFGTLENASGKGAAWQRTQLISTAQNCLFKAGSVTGNGDYTIGITDDGVIKRVIYMLDSATNNGISNAQVNWVKAKAASIASAYGEVPAFIFYNKTTATDYSSDFATANIDGVFMGNSPSDNSSTLSGGITYTYGTKTGTYGTYNANKLGGTYIYVSASGQNFTITAQCLNKDNMMNKESIHLVESYDGTSVVTDAYLAPVWDTDRIYDETGLFVGETGSVTLMYTPSDPYEVVVRDITLGVTYTYGIDYTVSGNRVTRVAGGNLPYIPYDKYYRSTPVYIGDAPQGFTVTPDGNGKAEDGYTIDGTKYLFFSEGFGGFKDYVTFTYNKTAVWTGTNITGDVNAQNFINKLKTDKEATIFFYGDSITVGCNASGTEYGDYRNPNLPAWNDLVTDYLASLYGANITKYNGARGGWQTFEGAENFTSKVSECGTTLASIDLLVLAYGINDVDKSASNYIANIESMIDAYLAANPSGSVLLVSPMKPNSQSELVSGNGEGCESALNTIRNKGKYSGKNISVANVFTMFNELVSVSGKLTRDYLGNNINHPNDFGVRLYAQVILKTLCGDDFN